MIEPTEADIGRGVVYRAGHPGAEAEDGAITSFNEHVVFVRYRNQHPGASGTPTSREDLDWLIGEDKSEPGGKEQTMKLDELLVGLANGYAESLEAAVECRSKTNTVEAGAWLDLAEKFRREGKALRESAVRLEPERP